MGAAARHGCGNCGEQLSRRINSINLKAHAHRRKLGQRNDPSFAFQIHWGYNDCTKNPCTCGLQGQLMQITFNPIAEIKNPQTRSQPNVGTTSSTNDRPTIIQTLSPGLPSNAWCSPRGSRTRCLRHQPARPTCAEAPNGPSIFPLEPRAAPNPPPKSHCRA